jgi:hypothetical protein
MENVKKDDRLAEAAREIFRTYGNNLQRYFDDLLGTGEATETSRYVESKSSSRMADVNAKNNAPSRRIP